MTNIETLLKQISEIVVKERIQQEEKRKRGENFNIFSVLGLSTSEVRLHSAFLGELLNPDGDHGLGDKFLEAFVDIIIKQVDPDFEIDITTCKVRVEYPIGEIPEDYTEGGRIDLLIVDDKNHAIVIENKIYADDQINQLLRYQNFAKRKTLKYVLLYLTLDKKEPEVKSTKNQVDYACIGYNDNILPWLQRCVEIAAIHPLIRETIRQYITNLNEILCIMEQDNLTGLLDILTSEENVSTTIDILTQSGDIQKRIRENFINDISNLCQKYRFVFKCDDGMKAAMNNSWITIFDKNYKDIQFRIGVFRHTELDGFRMCFVSQTRQAVKEKYAFWPNGNEPNSDFPFGWTYLWSETGEPNSGRWWRWDEWPTLRDMVNGKMLKFVESQLLRIKNEGVFKKMNDLLE